jgi:hypothetical protein
MRNEPSASHPAVADRAKIGTTGRPSTAASKRIDYGTVEHAGRPHRGVTTDAEKEIVRENLAAVNERLKREGHRIIDPTDEAMVERYSLDVVEA